MTTTIFRFRFQGVTQDGTQGVRQDELDNWIEQEIRKTTMLPQKNWQ